MKTFIKIVFMTCLLTTVGSKAYAGAISMHKRIEAGINGCSSITVGTPCANDTVYIIPASGSNFRDYNLEDVITLGIDHNSLLYYPDSVITTVQLSITGTDKSGSPIGTISQTLKVRYNPFTYTTYIDKAAFVFKNAYYYLVKITSITVNDNGVVTTGTLPANVYLDADINVLRYYDFTSLGNTTPVFVNAPDSEDIDCDGKADQLLISWAPQIGPEEYELEWTFVNDYDSGTGSNQFLGASQLAYDFRFNSTRITTTENSYAITLAYEHGYIIYRVRGVGVDMFNPSIDVTGIWSLPDRGNVSSVTSTLFHVKYPHEADDKNYQYNATFAEEGKKKEVITYYDGSLRSREAVTKMNSDSNVLVGQTIYDFQGRPAVTVLPTPVKFPSCGSGYQPSIHYYPAFNQVDSAGTMLSYTRYQFDLDKGDSCSVGADSMSVLSGASNYYSPQNPRQSGFQAYVPDGHGYPFSQVQYTPDNTGRVKSQGGVGPQFQLGSGHETKYVYGQPNQLELDRMFGSEAGDATHYKKNVVIDPNGQASISYLDQEGRTISTCLAGDPGKDSTGNYSLSPLPSQVGALQNLRVDLLAADANNHSNNNTVDVEGNAIVFNSQVSVAYSSPYRFKYCLKIDTLGVPCRNLCFECIYDLQIKVTNDCGQIVTSSNGENPLDTVLGNYNIVSTDTAHSGLFHAIGKDTIEFITACGSNHLYSDTAGFTLNLTPGNYTVSKILTVDSAALNFYVKQYLDSANSTGCVKTLYDFQQQAIAATDTCNCHISCQSCLTSLGDRDAFIAAGKGSAEQYDFLYDQCGAPCKIVTMCDMEYQQMLLDVSPDGQYGQYLTSTGMINPSSFPLSVFNINNHLPQNIASGTGNWHFPLVTLNGDQYPYYIDNAGNRSIINLIQVSTGVYLPAVVNSTDTNILRLNHTTGVYYTYPENLQNFSDFRQYWQSTWAQSLVQYHPEYDYYLVCQQYEQVQSPDTMSSETFDERMSSCQTFNEAVTAGFITGPPPYTGSVNSRLSAFFTTSGSPHMYDPFANDAIFETDYGSVSGLNLIFSNDFTNFQVSGSNVYSMVEAAAMTARCGIYSSTTSACTDFGNDYFSGGPVSANDSIRNKEWSYFKSFYFSQKQKLQKQVEDYYALYIGKQYNGCIGNSGFSSVGMWSGPLPWPIFNPLQPCSFINASYYAGKQRRFTDQTDVPNQGANNQGYQYYLQTGQCPAAGDLQAFLNQLALQHKLEATLDTLTNNLQLPEIVHDASGAYPVSGSLYEWKFKDTVGSVLTSYLINAIGNDTCVFTLNKASSGIAYWGSIQSFQSLQYTGTANGLDNFSILALISTPADSAHPYQYKLINGSSCIPIHGCQFQTECQPNQLSIDMSRLMTALAVNTKLTGTDVNLEDAAYQQSLTPTILNVIGIPHANMRWSFVSGNEFDLYDSANPGTKLKTFITQFTPATFTTSNLNTIKGFDSVIITGQNLFNLNGLNSSDSLLVTVSFSSSFTSGSSTVDENMGNCDLPTPSTCQGIAYENVSSLTSLLYDRITQRPYSADVNITKSPFYTPQIKSYLPAVLDSSSSKEDSSLHGSIFTDTLKFKLYVNDTNGGHIYWDSNACPFYLVISDTSKIARYAKLTNIQQLTGTGNINNTGGYNDFYFVATFSNGPTWKRVDTVHGTSCIQLLNCLSCVSISQTPVTYQPPVIGTTDTNRAIPRPLFPPSSFKPASLSATTDYAFRHDSTIIRIPVIATGPDMIFDIHPPVLVADTPFAHIKLIEVDSLSGVVYDSIIGVRNLHNNDTIPSVEAIGLDSGKTYYVKVVRYSLMSCPVCADSTSYFGLSYGTPATFVNPVLPACDAVAYGPNLLYDGDFETVPQFAYNPPSCYQVRSVKFPNLAPDSTTIGYPTTSAMRFSACSILRPDSLNHDYTDMYFVGKASTAPVPAFAAHSGTHYMVIDAPSDSCKSCSLTDSTSMLYTPNHITVAWHQTVHTVPGQTYRLAAWFKTADLGGIVGNTVGLTVNDTLYAHLHVISGQWKELSFCWVANRDSANIKVLAMGGAELFGYDCFMDDISFETPLSAPCSNTLLTSVDTVIPPNYTPKGGNPCVNQLVNNASQNAENSYLNYLDSLGTKIRTLYMNHCLQPVESLISTYQDKQYHYTLYYYDQAGNLIRTVPPQGVQLLPITEYSSPEEVQIIHDRTYNQHTVFTNDVLSSTYVYNSLNQLTAQTVPDDDNMQIWNFTLPNGLNSALTVTGTQFIDAANGYLSGYVLSPTSVKRGYLYKTHDAGHTWQQVNGTAGVNVRKILMLNSSIEGFAVGDNGIVMVSQDVGNTWDIQSLYNYGIIQRLNALATDGSTVAIVGDGIAFTLDATSTGTPYYASSGISSTDTLTSVTYDAINTAYYAAGDSSGYGVFYRGTLSGHTMTWLKQSSNISSLPICKEQFLRSFPSHGFAAGLNGTLMHTTDKGAHWYMVPPSTVMNIRDIYFISDNVGIALMDSSQQHCKLYTTGNGGKTWTLLSKTGEIYYAMNFYRDSASHTYKGVAVGYGGLVMRLVSNATISPYFGEVPINSPTTSDLKAVFAQATVNGTINMLIGGKEDNVYATFNANGSTASWNTIAVPTAIQKAAFVLGGGTSNYMLPALIDNYGSLLRLKTTAGTAPVLSFADSSSATGDVYTAIAEAGKTDGNDSLYAIDINGSGTGTKILYAPTTITSGSELGETSLSSTSTINSVAYTGNGSFMAADSNTAKLYTGKISSGSITWTDVSTRVHSNGINGIQAFQRSGSAAVYEVGDKGRVYYSNVNSSSVGLNALAGPSLKKLYSLLIGSATTGFITGDSSAFYVYVYSALSGYHVTYTAVSVPVSNIPLYDIALQPTIPALYVAGGKGTMLYVTNSSGLVANLAVSGGNTDFRSVSVSAYGVALVAGDQSNMWSYSGTSGLNVPGLYGTRFNAEHFIDVNHGYAVGDSGIIRRTDNGGVLWQTVLPEINSNGVPDYKTVWTTSTGNAIIAGTGSFMGHATSANVTVGMPHHKYLGATGTTWNKVRFNANYLNSGYLVGTNDSVLNLIVSSGVLTGYSVPALPTASSLSAANFYSLHVFRDNSLMAIGDGGRAYYYNGTAWSDYSPSNTYNSSSHYSSFTWNDIDARDDRTIWMVGDSAGNAAGEIVKTIIPVNIQTATPSQAAWNLEPIEDGLTANSIVTTATQVNMNAIAFSNPYDGFIGGGYTSGYLDTATHQPVYPYARLINDRGGVFSLVVWYDRLGHPIVKQDTKQHSYRRPAYTYTILDALNRIIETGQKTENTDTANSFNKIFGDTVLNSYNPNAISSAKYLAWIKDNTGPRTEVMHAYYDIQAILPSSIAIQSELRGRPVSVTYADTLRADSTKYDNATHYSYDVAGYVNSIIQDDSVPGITGQRYKKINYQYDLISGIVNEVDYQPGEPDRFYHKYSFDKDFRIISVCTSRDSINWDNDAHYFYNALGQDAREEIGDQHVQGVDYAYTLLGKIKGVNSDQLNGTNDIGHDGQQESNNLNRNFARDAMGYTLKYFTGDYDAISSTVWTNVANRFEANSYHSDLMNSRHDLFNGNISAMVTTITQPQTYYQNNSSQVAITLPQGTSYNYDQQDRLINMKAYQNLNLSSNSWGVGGGYHGLYYDSVSYDANGNILTQQRNDSVGGIMSQLQYHYNIEGGRTLQNRLYLVNNTATAPNPLDIKDEGIFDTAEGAMNQKNNYRYTALGELAKDTIGGIDTVIWTHFGQIWKIKKYNGDSIIYSYDAVNRSLIMKEFKPFNASPICTHYVNDGQGNIMAVYTKQVVGTQLNYTLKEHDIYGNGGRMGTDNTPIQLIAPTPISQIDTFARYIGNKVYELDNHLGNVLVVVSDRKIPIPNAALDSVNHYEADVVSANDYYPFGMVEPGRNFKNTKMYIYAFNGKLKSDEIYGANDAYNYGARMYDPRLGRFLSTDPEFRKYPELSVYEFAGNCPIRALDIAGKEPAYTDANGQQVSAVDAVSYRQYIPAIGYHTSSNGFKPVSVYIAHLKTEDIGGKIQVIGFTLEFVGIVLLPFTGGGSAVLIEAGATVNEAGTIITVGTDLANGEPGKAVFDFATDWVGGKVSEGLSGFILPELEKTSINYMGNYTGNELLKWTFEVNTSIVSTAVSTVIFKENDKVTTQTSTPAGSAPNATPPNSSTAPIQPAQPTDQKTIPAGVMSDKGVDLAGINAALSAYNNKNANSKPAPPLKMQVKPLAKPNTAAGSGAGTGAGAGGNTGYSTPGFAPEIPGYTGSR